MHDLERDDKMIYCEIMRPMNTENCTTEHIATVEVTENGISIIPEDVVAANWLINLTPQQALILSKHLHRAFCCYQKQNSDFYFEMMAK